jgi:hypothetical protein
MCKVASEESVNPTIHQVKLGKSKIVQVRVHLMSRPSQIKEIEQAVKEDYQKGNIAIW